MCLNDFMLTGWKHFIWVKCKRCSTIIAGRSSITLNKDGSETCNDSMLKLAIVLPVVVRVRVSELFGESLFLLKNNLQKTYNMGDQYA